MLLGLMAISAGSAQAAKWLILNSKGEVKTGTELPAEVKGELEEGTTGVLLATILGLETEILCSAGELIGIKLEAAGALTNGGKVKFTGCDVKLGGELNEECEAHSAGKAVGTIETLEGKGLLELILGAGMTKLVAKTGTTLVTVEMGNGCPLGTKVPIAGALVLEDSEVETHKVVHLIKENTAHSTLTALGKSAKIDGSALVSLAGSHAGLAWSGDKE